MHFPTDWRSVKFDWNRARAFLVPAEEGSLSAARMCRSAWRSRRWAWHVGGPAGAERRPFPASEGGASTFTVSGLERLDHVRAMGDAADRVSLSAIGTH